MENNKEKDETNFNVYTVKYMASWGLKCATLSSQDELN